MKWFKHYSDASEDEFIAELEDEFGLEGYARWWKLLEVIAKQMDETDRCYAEYSWQNWQRFLKAKRNKLETFLEHSQNKRKIKLEQTGNKLRIICPKLLELRDNHTKNLQAKKQVTCKQEVEVEEDISVTNVTGDESPPDLKKIIFDSGMDWLCKQTGKPKEKLRPLIGKWISQGGEARVSAAFMDAQRCSAIEPVAYIEKILAKHKTEETTEDRIKRLSEGFENEPVQH